MYIPGFQNVCLDHWVHITPTDSTMEREGAIIKSILNCLLQEVQTCGVSSAHPLVLAMVGKGCSCCVTSCAVTRIRSTFPSTTPC